jgi:hypothetical protein
MRTTPVLGAPQRAAFVRDGYLVLHRALSTDLIAELLDTLEVHEARVRETRRPTEGGCTGRRHPLS